jgi:hypothetical protein
MRVFAMAGVISISMVGCAHEIKNIRNVPAVTPVAISPYARPAQEIENTQLSANNLSLYSR